MIHSVIQKNTYQDSITLMLMTNAIAVIEGVNKVSIMMATPANKDILHQAGFNTPELNAADANDIAIMLDITEASVVPVVMENIEVFLENQGKVADNTNENRVTNWKGALAHDETNLALFSIPGEQATTEVETALNAGKHVFLFSDNMSLEDEVYLKQLAYDKGLLLMGPDCGTASINGVPLAFTNVLKKGKIGIVGASGTGIQEVSTQIVHMGSGISQAFGTGGRDLSEAVGGLTMKTGIAALAEDPMTDVIVVISKPPAEAVRNEIIAMLRSIDKPAVVVFMGEKPVAHETGIYYAYTLEEAAKLAVAVSKQEIVNYYQPQIETLKKHDNKKIWGLYAGGTLAQEASVLLSDALSAPLDTEHPAGYMFNKDGHIIIDLGDDVYTQGRPHPMIDPHNRIEWLEKAIDAPEVGVVLLDLVLGYGASEDMATSLAPAIKKLTTTRSDVTVIVTICGTQQDPQNIDVQRQILSDAGAITLTSNASAVMSALTSLGLCATFNEKVVEENKGAQIIALPAASTQVKELMDTQLDVLNIGLTRFLTSLQDSKTQYVQFDWKPLAGGNIPLQKTLAFLNNFSTDNQALLGDYKTIDEANQAVTQKIMSASPFLVDVIPARIAIPELKKHVLLHAGPPIKYENMTSPMQGSCVGAILFESWAEDEKAARQLLESGAITFIPCHHVNAVGPMGGITSMSMPVLDVINKTDGNHAYCTMNEGIGAVLRFGAYGPKVVERLRWMRDVLGPTLSKILKEIPEGINVNVLATKSLAMGDEFHQRNIAASANFFKEVAPILVNLPIDAEEKSAVMKFLADTDQFFLNIMMASCKAIMDAARTIKAGTIVTAMTRNGENFGVRISGMGDTWFTAPVNTPDGLYFTGYSSLDANPDIGDSAITETFGVGGMAMIAAPAVTRFVGSGGFYDALNTSNEMMEICIARNINFPVPTWDFQGICLGIDARKVVETQITPVINTGIAHKEAGIGQIGAGTVRPPLGCFEQAITAYEAQIKK